MSDWWREVAVATALLIFLALIFSLSPSTEPFETPVESEDELEPADGVSEEANGSEPTPRKPEELNGTLTEINETETEIFGEEEKMQSTITWSDSSQETIRVDGAGHVYLNGGEGQAFGFVIMGSGSPPSASVANTILDWCQSNSVRFMVYIARTSSSQGTIESRLDFWIPKLYAHKMFVIVWYHPRASQTKAEALDTTDFKNKFKIAVDKIISLNRKEMVVAFIGGEEWDIHVEQVGITQSELEAWFDDADPYMRSYLSTNNFSRPVGHSPLDPAHWAGVLSVQYSDFVFNDFFTGGNVPSTQDYYWNLKSQGWDDANKTGYQAWLPSAGYGVGANGDNSKLTPEYFTNMLGKTRLSAYFIWHLWEDWQGGVEKHWMFKSDGTPEYWTAALAPYFPTWPEPLPPPAEPPIPPPPEEEPLPPPEEPPEEPPPTEEPIPAPEEEPPPEVPPTQPEVGLPEEIPVLTAQSKLFSRALKNLSSYRAIRFDQVLAILEKQKAPTFDEVLKALEKMRGNS